MKQASFIVGFSIVMVGCSAGNQQPFSAETEYSPFVNAADVSFNKIKSPSELTDKISTLGGPQKQFETNFEFETRMAKIEPFEVCKEVDSKSIKFDPVSGTSTYKEWLQDAQLAEYRDARGEIFSDSKRYYPSITVAFDSRKTGEYIGHNSYGASAVVEMREAEQVHLVFDPILKTAYMFPHPFIEADTSGVAGKFDKFLLCVSSVPVSPYYREGIGASQPTIQSPSAGIIKHRMLRVKVGGFRLADINGKSIDGKVIFSVGNL